MSPSGKKTILLVNPWIHDFSAYDLWMKPLGLLYIGSLLRLRGFAIQLLDCVSVYFLPEEFAPPLHPPTALDLIDRGHRDAKKQTQQDR